MPVPLNLDVVARSWHLPPTRRHAVRIEIVTVAQKSYVVSQNPNTGKWACSCLGHIHYKRCKHLVAA